MDINSLIIFTTILNLACFCILIFHLDYFFRRILSLMETQKPLNTPTRTYDVKPKFRAKVPKPENQV